MQRILITGCNGFLGQKLVELLSGNPDIYVIATSRGYNRLSFDSHYDYDTLDITNKIEVDYILTKYEPHTVINCAAMSSPDECEHNKEACWQINVEGVRNLAESSNKMKSHFIHLSTDFIFDGLNGPYLEEDMPNPVSHYGLSKLESERIVKGVSNKWSIIRTVLVYGIPNDTARNNFFLWVKTKLEKSEEINVVGDQYRTPTLVEDLALGTSLVALKGKEGIYHISGSDMINVADFAYIISDIFELDSTLIGKLPSDVIHKDARRPLRTGFIIDKAVRELEFLPRSLYDGLHFLKESTK